MKLDKIAAELKISFENKPLIFKGGNSHVIKGHIGPDQHIAVKVYKGETERINRMLSREKSALTFLTGHGIRNIPQLIHCRSDLGLITYKWIDGKAPNADSSTMDSIITMIQSLHELFNINPKFDSAIDASYSLSDIQAQIKFRLCEFNKLEPSKISHIIQINVAERLSKLKQAKLSNQMFARKTLSLSDFGTHNMLVSPAGSYFIDFEFFGVDSVEKLLGDFILHPQNNFNDIEISKFIDSIQSMTQFRIEVLKPVLLNLALKWSLIALRREISQFRFKQAVLNDMQLALSHLKCNQYLQYFDYLESDLSADVPQTFNKFISSLGLSSV